VRGTNQEELDALSCVVLFRRLLLCIRRACILATCRYEGR